MKKALRLSFLACMLTLLSTPIALGAPPQQTLDSMAKELERNQKNLSVPGYPPPYYLSYLLRDTKEASVIARNGAPILRREDHRKLVFADVRVGSFELDNTEDPYPGMDMPNMFKPFQAAAPLVDDDRALRRTLWAITDNEYKKAVASYLKIKAQGIYEETAPSFKGSFSKAQSAQYIAQERPFIESLESFEKTTGEISTMLEEVPEIFELAVAFTAVHHDRYFVNSEGTRLFLSDTYYSFSVQATARGEDGAIIPHALVLYSRSLKEIPTREELEKQVKLLIEELVALAKAPVMPPYNGPALLEGDTAGVFLHEALGHRLEGHRQNQEDEGGTFRGKLGDLILPESISIVDDPTLETREGMEMNGYYRYDDEGVPAQRVLLVDRGKLSGFLMTRRPTEDFKTTNGHARASGLQRPVARMGTLMLESTNLLSREEMKKRLVALAKKQGKPYAIILRRAASGATNTSAWGFQAFKGVARLVYRVDVETGEETLVRGVELVGTPLSSLMKIVAVGGDVSVFNGYCGAESGFVPVSTVTPSLLLEELEFQKAPQIREKKEILPPPTL